MDDILDYRRAVARVVASEALQMISISMAQFAKEKPDGTPSMHPRDMYPMIFEAMEDLRRRTLEHLDDAEKMHMAANASGSPTKN